MLSNWGYNNHDLAGLAAAQQQLERLRGKGVSSDYLNARMQPIIDRRNYLLGTNTPGSLFGNNANTQQPVAQVNAQQQAMENRPELDTLQSSNLYQSSISQPNGSAAYQQPKNMQAWRQVPQLLGLFK